MIDVGGPTGPVDPETLLDGYASALIAVLHGRPMEVLRLNTRFGRALPSAQGTRRACELHQLTIRALLMVGRTNDAARSLDALSEATARNDDAALRARLAVLHADVAAAQGRPADALALLDKTLRDAANKGLGLDCIDLLLVRGRSLHAGGRPEEARAAACAAVLGAEAAPAALQNFPALSGMTGSVECAYRAATRQGVDLLRALGVEVPQHVAQGLRGEVADMMPPAPPPRAPRPEPKKESGLSRRGQLDDEARRVIKDYEERGVPFVLYFRKSGFTVMHGPMEYGTRLTENVLRDALPPGVNIITIQDPESTISYTGSEIRLERAAPALLLDDDNWQKAAVWLIQNADLIVSEALMLSKGVQFELERIFNLRKGDRTVLLLPPLNAYLPTIDSDASIQLFVRCVWADGLHTQSIDGHNMVRDLLERVGKIGALPDGTRQTLRKAADREKAFPVDLRAIARTLEAETLLLGQYADDDDARYYLFWKLFRAASIRTLRYVDGVADEDNSALASLSRQMSAILLHGKREADCLVLEGDLEFAEQCAHNAFVFEAKMGVRQLQDLAEQQYASVLG